MEFRRSNFKGDSETVTAIQRLRRPQASPLRYPGGKGALYPMITQLLRVNDLIGCRYVEPYAGGAGAGLALLLSGQVSELVINDLDPAIWSMWKAAVSNPQEFIARVHSTALDVAEWKRQKQIYASGRASDQFDLGFATFYLNRTNRSGILNGGPIGGLDQSGSYKIDARFNRDALAERIRLIGLHSNSIIVANRDGSQLVLEQLRRQRTFIYADPPYFEKAGSLYMNTFAMKDHARLATVLNRANKKPWMLTYDDDPRVHELYSSRSRSSISLNYSAHRVAKSREVLVLSDVLTDVASEARTGPQRSEDRTAASGERSEAVLIQ